MKSNPLFSLDNPPITVSIGVNSNEENISAECEEKEKQTRFSATNGNKERPGSPLKAPSQGTMEANSER